jgi:hypothetical protein
LQALKTGQFGPPAPLLGAKLYLPTVGPDVPPFSLWVHLLGQAVPYDHVGRMTHSGCQQQNLSKAVPNR